MFRCSKCLCFRRCYWRKMFLTWFLFAGIAFSCQASRLVPYDTEAYDRKDNGISSEGDDYSEEFEYGKDLLQDPMLRNNLLRKMEQFNADFINSNLIPGQRRMDSATKPEYENPSHSDRHSRNVYVFKNRTVQCRAVPYVIDLYRKFDLDDNDQLHESFPREFKEWKCKRVREEDVAEYVEYPCTYFPQDMGDKRLCYVTTAHAPCRSMKKSMYFWIRRRGEHWQPVTLDVYAGCHCNYEFIHI